MIASPANERQEAADALEGAWGMLEIAAKRDQDQQAEIERLRDVLARLSNRHAGYEQAMGPCICDAHVEARDLLRSDN